MVSFNTQENYFLTHYHFSINEDFAYAEISNSKIKSDNHITRFSIRKVTENRFHLRIEVKKLNIINHLYLDQHFDSWESIKSYLSNNI